MKDGGVTVGRARSIPRRPPRTTLSASGLPVKAFITQEEITSHHMLFRNGQCLKHGPERSVLIHGMWRCLCCGQKEAA